MSTRGTPIDVPAQGSCPTALDCPKHAQVLRRQPGAMGLDEACPVLANDVGHLEGWPGHRFRFRRVRRTVSAPETGIASSGLATAWRCRCDKWR